MTSLPLEAEYPIETFSMFTNSSNLMFLASPWLKIYRYSNWSFCWLWAVQRLTLRSSRLIFILLTLGKSKLTLIVLFYYFEQTEFGQDMPWKTIQKNSRTTNRILHKSFFPQSINRLPRFSLLFLPVTRFSDFCDKIKYL